MSAIHDRLGTPEPPAPPDALTSAMAELRRSAPRHVGVVGTLCLGIAVLLTVIDGGGFWLKLLYSMSIGAACTGVVDLTRLAEAALSDRLRRSRGLPPSAVHSGWRGAVTGSLLAVVIGPTTGLWLADLVSGHRSPSLLDLSLTSTRLTLLFSVLGTAVAISVMSSLERLAQARAEAEAARRQAAETQLRLLHSQLEPHMLFNTLANLRVLIGLDPARAQAMLDHLIAFLRTTLQASRAAEHPLGTEFERVADYLALMDVRMGSRLQVVLDLPDALTTLPVPPLLLQPLVENAVKHGLEPQVQGGRIEVRAHRQGALLELTVRDTGAGLPATAQAAGAGGFGLQQVRERLATLYGGAASVTLSPAPGAEGGTLATLRLPLPGPRGDKAPAPPP